MMKPEQAREIRAIAGGRWAFPSSLALLFSVSLAVYWPHLDGFFALDDYVWLQAADTADVFRFFKHAFSFPAGTVFDYPTPFWRPVVDSYFFSAWRLFGLDPVPYHAANVVLHAVNAALLLGLLWQIGASRATSLIAALVFLLLPTYDFAVTWISGVTELLAVCFCLIALISFVAYLRGARPAALFYVGALLAFLLALLSKESSVTLPAMAAGLALVLGPPKSVDDLRHRIGEVLPFAGLALAYFVFLYVQEYEVTSEDGLYRFGWHFLENMWDYLKWITFPFAEAEIDWARRLQVVTAAAFIAAGVWTLMARKRIPAFFFAWVLAALLPYSFFESGIELRYTYAASIPLAAFAALMLSAAFQEARNRLGPWPSFTLAAGVFLVGAVFLAGEVRNHQAWIDRQAGEYSRLFHETPLLCGHSSPDRIYLVGSPLFDYHGSSTSMALNLVYENVSVHLVEGRAAMPSDLSKDDCILSYSGGGYTRIAGP